MRWGRSCACRWQEPRRRSGTAWRPTFDVRWKGRPLRAAARSLPAGSWSYSPGFAEVDAAHEWGMAPSAFRALDEEDRALMQVYAESRALMRAVEEHEMARQMKRARRKTGAE